LGANLPPPLFIGYASTLPEVDEILVWMAWIRNTVTQRFIEGLIEEASTVGKTRPIASVYTISITTLENLSSLRVTEHWRELIWANSCGSDEVSNF
jgi:hypothetical protein